MRKSLVLKAHSTQKSILLVKERYFAYVDDTKTNQRLFAACLT